MDALKDKCDFCSGKPSPWSYPASYGTDWGACQPCYELIQAGNRIGLLNRSVETIEVPKEYRSIMRAEIQKLHDGIFWKYCTVPPTYESFATDGETQRSES